MVRARIDCAEKTENRLQRHDPWRSIFTNCFHNLRQTVPSPTRQQGCGTGPCRCVGLPLPKFVSPRRSGGTVKEDRIEIQGDHRETVVAELEKLGYKVKWTGG